MDYLLKASAVLLIFYICYKLFLQRDTFFQTNRWFLLCGLVLASCIPLIVIPIYIEYTPIAASGFSYTTTHASDAIPNVIANEPFDYLQVIIWTYIAGILFFIGKLCVEFLSLRKVLKTSEETASTGYFKLLETSNDVAPFSFFNKIVYNPNQFSTEELTHVINHEKIHAKQYHSIDTIIAQLSCILFWFNPIVWLYKKAVQQNLEFIADQKAQYISPCEKSYQTVLLKASVQNHQLAFTNNFYTSLIKKRIVMLHKSKSKKLNQLKLILVLPLLAGFMMSYNTKTIYIETNTDNEENTEEVTDQDEIIEIIITKSTSDDNLLEIKDALEKKGITFNYKDVKRNSDGDITAIHTEFKSEKNSSNYNISGDEGIKSFRFKSDKNGFGVGTLDSNTFTYKTKGSGSSVKMQSTKGSGKVLIIEEDDDNGNSTVDVRVLKNKDSVYLMNKDDKITWSSDDNNSNVFIEDSDEPLFIINGKKVKKSLFEDVDSDDIESVFVIKGDNALKKYGKDGKNGVILMTKKGSKSLFSESEDTIILNSSNNFTFETDGDEPLYILNGTVITKDKMSAINSNDINSVEVLKDESAVKLYGKKGKNGVVIINSNGLKKSEFFSNGNKNVIVEVDEESPWKVETAVTSVQFFDDEHNSDTIEFIIVKNSSDAFLETQKNNLKTLGIDAKFTKVRRNKAGEITSIKISLDDNQGRKSSASWREKNQAIPDIVMGKSNDDKLYVRAIGN
ncbi:M56 family metallopeptidase [Psychroserpens sp.]|uniref:M56 family metallopeptidase n=1 Tax=Psychroserpens sp. TaxID=2020870 RepID=UPI002B276CA2|nr:M56 family metallopeptidase [Psychroserpens sp.]